MTAINRLNSGNCFMLFYYQIVTCLLVTCAAAADVEQLLRSATAATTDPTVTSARSTWSSVHGLPCPSGVIAHRQSSWDKPVITSKRETLTSSLSDSSDKARLHAPHSGDWLNALPLAVSMWTTTRYTSLLVCGWVLTSAK